MSNINSLVITELSNHINSPIAHHLANVGKQALVWGTGGGLSYLAGKDKTSHMKSIKNIHYAKEHNKALQKSILAGALAGAIGSSV